MKMLRHMYLDRLCKYPSGKLGTLRSPKHAKVRCNAPPGIRGYPALVMHNGVSLPRRHCARDSIEIRHIAGVK